MSATVGYPEAYRTVVDAFAEAISRYEAVINSVDFGVGMNLLVHCNRLKARQKVFSSASTKRFVEHEKNLRAVTRYLQAIDHLSSSTANEAKAALRRLLDAMKVARDITLAMQGSTVVDNGTEPTTGYFRW